MTGLRSYSELEDLLSSQTGLADAERQRLLEDLAALRETAARHAVLTAALDQLPDEIFIKDRQSRYVMANREAEFAVGAAPGAMIGKSDEAFFAPALADLFRLEDAEIMATGKTSYQAPFRSPLPMGGMRWNQITKYPVFDDDGAIVGVCGQVRQSTEMMQSRMLLEAQIGVLEMLAAGRPLEDVFGRIGLLIEEQLQEYLASILVLDETGTVVTQVIAPTMRKEYWQPLVGLTISEKMGTCGPACATKAPVFTEDIMAEANWEPFRSFATPFGLRSCWSFPYFNADGSVHGTFALYSLQPRLPNEFEKQCLALGSRLAELAVERERTAAQIRLMSERDSLTGLPNRAAFAVMLAQEIATAKANEQEIAVAVIDVDDFKHINDRYGHAAGDRFLSEFSQCLVGGAGEGAIAARLGGDEFAVVFKSEAGSDPTCRLARLVASFEPAIEIDRQRLGVAVSAGLAIFPRHALDAGALLSHADAAMHRAKQRGHSRIEVYDPEFSRERELHRRKIELLRHSIFNGAIDLDFQPLVSVRSGAVFGYEALARWQHPQEGRLGPGAFIPLAEREGLIVDLGGSVLTRACREIAHLAHASALRRSVSVNVSAQQFAEGRILDQVRSALAESGLDPALLELELTESMLLDDEDQAINIMSDLKALGVSIAIDDFGTGFSNLSALARLPVDRLKIDRSIIRDIETNAASASIASAIVAMGQRLGLKVLAEGVETVGQMEFLRDNNCDDLQGFLFGRPIPCADLWAIFASGRGPDAMPGSLLAGSVNGAPRRKAARQR